MAKKVEAAPGFMAEKWGTRDDLRDIGQELNKVRNKHERVAEDGTPDYPITSGEPEWNSLVETFIARRNQNKSLVED